MGQYESILSRYYDDLVGDLDSSKKWVDWVEKWAFSGSFLELGCGSGAITSLLAQNHSMSALDLSASMLEEAKKRDINHQIHFIQGDMRNLDGLGKFDAIGCFCDSFNYLTDFQEVEDFFQTVADHLSQGGWFFLDSHGLSRLQEFYSEEGDYGYEEEGVFEDGTQLEWRIRTEEDFLFQDFAFYLPNERPILEHHIQRVYSPDFLREALQKAGFEIVEMIGDFGEESLEECEKYFFACRLIK